ncbi:MAG: hypothetical protein Q8M95_16040 [Candidatus Methanoperedens sp.]|nr:hypothetical protein [Candidatus Methanoperedens sp.]
MKKCVLFLTLLYFVLFILPVATAIIEEDWGNYTRIDETKRDGSGNTVTLNLLRKSYTSDDGKYTVTARDFDAQGTVVLDISFMGRQETLILKGEWDANRMKIIFTPPEELFNKMMIITPKKMVPPAGVFTCCPEAEINIDLIRPELFLEFKEDKTAVTYQYLAVDPFANWSNDAISKISPFDNSTESVTINIEDIPNAYRINEQIPVELTVTNHGDAESHDNVVYIDTDGLIIEEGMAYYQLPSLSGKNQKNLAGPSSHNIKMKLKFPYPPKKLNYTIHAYVKGVKEGVTYYYDATNIITLLPSVKLQKSATKESMLPSRQEVERIYHSIDANEIYRWLQGGEVYVSIGVTNYQNHEIKGLKLTDSPGRQLIVDNQSLAWTFDLKPFEAKEFKYRVKALRPGTFRLPPAELTYSDLNRTWSLFSTTPSTEVHGPCVQVYKKPDSPVIPPGSNVTINVTIRNSGDMPSRVKIMDMIPENSTFIGGILYYEGVLAPKDSAIISYNISIETEGQVQLPAPSMFINGREDTGCGEPLLSKIMVKEPAQPTPVKTISVPVETPLENLTPPPGQQYRFLEGLIPALMLILAVAVLIILHRSNK